MHQLQSIWRLATFDNLALLQVVFAMDMLKLQIADWVKDTPRELVPLYRLCLLGSF